MSRSGWPTAETLRTERLTLEPLRVDHAGEMAVVLADPALYAYTGGSPPSEAELAERYARQVRGASPDGSQGWLNWVLRSRSRRRLVGVVQVTLAGHACIREAELAWVVGVRDQGAGFASEAASAVIAWLRTLRVEALSAYIHPDNLASAAVARRLGLSPTPELRRGEVRWAAHGPLNPRPADVERG